MNEPAGWYYLASSERQGALGILSVFADEAALEARLDTLLVRASGTRAVAEPLPDHALRYGWLAYPDGQRVDEIMLAKPAAGHRVLMIHGGQTVRQAVTELLEEAGFARLEDTAAASKHDPLVDPLLAGALTQTQAAMVLEAREHERAGGEFSVPEGVLTVHRVLLAGPPNAGKSSLLNHLAGYHRAFVHEDAGATLDVVDELVDLGGLAVLVGDMPGFRDERGRLEHAAWTKSMTSLGQADAVFFVCDGSCPWDSAVDDAASAVADLAAAPVMVVVNKADLPHRMQGEPWRRHFPTAPHVRVSALPGGDALEVLGRELWSLLGTPYDE